MIKSFFAFSTFLLLTLSNPLLSQGDAAQGATNSRDALKRVPKDLTQKISNFFNSLLAKNISEGYDELMKGSPLGLKKEEIKNLVSQTKRSFDIYGALLEYEPVNAEIVSDSYVRVRYLGLHAKFPMRWVFTYYKSPEVGWILTNIKFDDLSEFFFIDD